MRSSCSGLMATATGLPFFSTMTGSWAWFTPHEVPLDARTRDVGEPGWSDPSSAAALSTARGKARWQTQVNTGAESKRAEADARAYWRARTG